MTAGEVVMLAWWLASGGLIVVAIAFAVWLSRGVHRPALYVSRDCRIGLHTACHESGACQDCHCHLVEAVRS